MVAKLHTEGKFGDVQKTVTVESNDPQHGQVVLQFRVKIEQPISVFPTNFVNMIGTQGDKLQNTFVLRRGDGQRLTLSEATSSLAEVKVELQAVTVANADPPEKTDGAHAGDWRLLVSVPDVTKQFQNAGQITVKTDHPERPLMSLPLQVSIAPVLMVTPAQVEMSYTIGSNVPGVATLDFRRGGYKAFRISDVKFKGDLDGLVGRNTTETRLIVQRVELRVNGTVTPGVHHGTVIVTTDIPILPTFEVPVVLRVNPAEAAPAS